jgi:hypothetical protein
MQLLLVCLPGNRRRFGDTVLLEVWDDGCSVGFVVALMNKGFILKQGVSLPA